ITPTATAADGPSLEFNQSSYELNDTVEVKLTDSNLNKSVIYLNIYSSSDRIRKVENEFVTKAIGHTTVNPVGDRNNDYAVNKSDLNIGLSDRDYKIKRVYRAKSASYIVDFEPSTNFGHLFLNYDNAHTVQLTHEEQNQHIGIFDITNNSSDKSRLHVQSGDNITVLFPEQLGSESYISESVQVLESNSSVNDYRSDNSTQESYSNTSHNFNNSSNPDLNNTPT
ncbi:MAG: hypothetical protein RI544_08060, partial [Haloquadratum sp.]|nr:hypothetical protein [Haloquadratum sp.]